MMKVKKLKLRSQCVKQRRTEKMAIDASLYMGKAKTGERKGPARVYLPFTAGEPGFDVIKRLQGKGMKTVEIAAMVYAECLKNVKV